MTRTVAAGMATLFLLATPGFAQSQLVASAGLSPAEAAGLSLTEIAQVKFDRDADGQVIVEHGVSSPAAKASLAASAGLSPAEVRGLSLS